MKLAQTTGPTLVRKAETKRKKKFNFEEWEKETSKRKS